MLISQWHKPGKGLPCERCGDARRVIWIKALKDTNMGVAKALFGPLTIPDIMPDRCRSPNQHSMTAFFIYSRATLHKLYTPSSLCHWSSHISTKLTIYHHHLSTDDDSSHPFSPEVMPTPPFTFFTLPTKRTGWTRLSSLLNLIFQFFNFYLQQLR